MQEAPIIIIGAGPAGLMAAQRLAESGKTVHIYEQNKAAARKFLVAGHGGFNLTHSEEITSFVEKYDKYQIREIVSYFDNNKTINWLNDIGIETYVGTSGKIFPSKGIKPIEVLQAWLGHLEKLQVKFFYGYTFIDFLDNEAILIQDNCRIKQKFSKLILALGGGSWKKTGSDAKWIDILTNKNIAIIPLASANSGYETMKNFADLEGQTLKNIKVSFNETEKKGELVFTTYGLEGSAIYFMNRFTRSYSFPLRLSIDLKPTLGLDEIFNKLKLSKNISKALKEKLNINSTSLALLKKLDKEIFTDPNLLAKNIKSYPIEVTAFRPIDEVISTSGGVSFEALNSNLSLKAFPNVYTIGEMVDWEAPTGGYLLQACFSMGYYCAEKILGTKNPV